MKSVVYKAFALILVALLLLAMPVLAISDPTSGPTIERIDIYRHTLETDDQLILVQYHLDYTTNPDETINQAFLGRYMNGAVELSNVAPYSYYDKGYDHGVFSMYLSASEAPTWEGSYSVKFEGNPTLSWQDLSASSDMSGAVADDGGVQTDETTASNNATTDDMTLLPATPAVNDAYYFGDDKPFDILTVNISTSGDGVWSLVWEYWSESEWKDLSGVSDYTTHFRAAAGNRNATFTLPSDWTKTTVKAINAYWIRARVYDYTSVVTAPKGAQSWTNVADAPPSTTSSTLNWRSTTTSQATELLLSSQIISVANQLSDYWSVALTEETSGGTKLSSYGESYFQNAIPNLRAMCPNVFTAGLVAPEYEEKEYTQSYASTLMNRWSGTGVDTAFQNLSDWSTVPLEVLKGLIWFIPVGMIAFYASSATGDMRNALFIVLLTLPLGSLLGMLTVTITVIAALACIIALAYAIFYRRATG